MLSNITWMEYLIGLGIVMIIYYLYVIIRYYPDILRTPLPGDKGLVENTPPLGDPLMMEDDEGDDEGQQATGFDNDYVEVDDLIAALKRTIEEASRKKMVPQEFKYYLRLVLDEYPNMKESSFRPSINELIVSECEKYGTIALSEEEADRLWLNNG